MPSKYRIETKRVCKKCNKQTVKYSNKHDAYYCENCNKWLEKVCDDKTCKFCKGRPKTPKEIISWGDILTILLGIGYED